MNEVSVLLLLTACVGLHWILKYGTILNPFRDVVTKIKLVKKLFGCSLCLGFWCGVVVGMLYGDPLILAFASAGVCWFADNINNLVQSVEIKLDKPE